MRKIVSNWKVYDLEESIRASGYPKHVDLDWDEPFEKALKRAILLVNAAEKDNDAHAQFETGIRVNFDLTFSNKAWVEAERYRFLEFISSQSTMHCAIKFDLDKQFNEYVDKRIIEVVKEKVQAYNNLVELNCQLDEKVAKGLKKDLSGKIAEAYLEIVYNLPAGFILTARMTTNYRCLRNIWKQRRHHKLPEWREFCKWIESLPYAKELICIEKE